MHTQNERAHCVSSTTQIHTCEILERYGENNESQTFKNKWKAKRVAGVDRELIMEGPVKGQLILRASQTICPCKPSNILFWFKTIITYLENSFQILWSLWNCSFSLDLWNRYKTVFFTFALISSLMCFPIIGNYLTLLGWGLQGRNDNADRITV